MLDNIVGLLEGLGAVVVAIGQFIAEFLKDAATTLSLLIASSAYLPTLLGWLPQALLAVIVSTFGVVILYKVFGREG